MVTHHSHFAGNNLSNRVLKSALFSGLLVFLVACNNPVHEDSASKEPVRSTTSNDGVNNGGTGSDGNGGTNNSTGGDNGGENNTAGDTTNQGTQQSNQGENAAGDTSDSNQTTQDNSRLVGFGDDGIAFTETALANLLVTKFKVVDEQLIPTTAWICSDGVSQSRTYYIYGAGVLDAGRPVAVERTLNEGGSFTDIAFYWTTTSPGSIALISAERDSNGVLQSTDRQYDVSDIRFQMVEQRTTFTAASVLRASLICGYYDLS